MDPKTLNRALSINNFYLIGIFSHIIGYILIMCGLAGFIDLKMADTIGFPFSIIGLLILLGLIMAYIHRAAAAAWLQVYYRYMIRTFWITLVYNVVCGVINALLMPKNTFTHPEIAYPVDLGNIGVILILFILVSGFFILRTLKARKYLKLQQPIPNPTTWKV